MQHEGPATLVTHCAVFGRHETKVRKISTQIVSPYSQYENAIFVHFTAPRKRRGAYTELPPDNLRWAEIVVNGAVVWDSRNEIPCDMEKWNAVADEHANRSQSVRRKIEEKGFVVILDPYPGNETALTCEITSLVLSTQAILVEKQEQGWRAMWLLPRAVREWDQEIADRLVAFLAAIWPGAQYHASGKGVLASIAVRERIVATGLLPESEAMAAAGLMNDWLTDNWMASKFVTPLVE